MRVLLGYLRRSTRLRPSYTLHLPRHIHHPPAPHRPVPRHGALNQSAHGPKAPHRLEALSNRHGTCNPFPTPAIHRVKAPSTPYHRHSRLAPRVARPAVEPKGYYDHHRPPTRATRRACLLPYHNRSLSSTPAKPAVTARNQRHCRRSLPPAASQREAYLLLYRSHSLSSQAANRTWMKIGRCTGRTPTATRCSWRRLTIS